MKTDLGETVYLAVAISAIIFYGVTWKFSSLSAMEAFLISLGLVIIGLFLGKGVHAWQKKKEKK